jgi:hypothetical protein
MSCEKLLEKEQETAAETTNVRENEAKNCALHKTRKPTYLRKLRNKANRGNVRRQDNNKKHQKTVTKAIKTFPTGTRLNVYSTRGLFTFVPKLLYMRGGLTVTGGWKTVTSYN